MKEIASYSIEEQTRFRSHGVQKSIKLHIPEYPYVFPLQFCKKYYFCMNIASLIKYYYNMFSFLNQSKVPELLQNKYLLVIIAFIIWMLFFDTNKISTQFVLNRKIKSLETQIADYKAKIGQSKKDAIDLELNKEKYARENYYMHTPGEDVYIMNSKK